MRKMITLRLTSLILAVFLLLHALKHSLAQAHQAKVANDISRHENHVFSRKELVDGNIYVAKAKTATMGGRKMIVTHEVQANDDHRVTQNPTSVFSGAPKVNDSSGFEVKGDLDMHYKVNDHTTSGYSSVKLNEAFSTTDYHGNDEARNALEITSSMRSNDESHNQVEDKAFGNSKPTSDNSNKATITQEYKSRTRKDDESKRYLKAAKEMMKLMHRDYGRWQKPKRRPPINNHSSKH